MKVKIGLVLYELSLVSQLWQGKPWSHTISLISPKRLQTSPTLVLLIITGSGRREKEISIGSDISNLAGVPVAVLNEVPNQPLLGGLKEDRLIAETFVRYIKTGDLSLPLLFPMVKSAVKAMDAIEEFMNRERKTPIAGFVVSGASKRGWTTWLTPVVDSRVKAIVPIVYDNLDMKKQMKHQLERWGKFSEEICAYTGKNLPQKLISDDQKLARLMSLVDPFAYRKEIVVPKLMIIGTNDKCWPIDALNIYYDGLVGEKYVLYVPNAGHGLSGGMARVVADISAFILKTAGEIKFPKLTWIVKEGKEKINISVTSDIKPRAVNLWVAKSHTKDFREARWNKLEIRPQGNLYTYSLKKPDKDNVAIFSEAVYSMKGMEFFLSTPVKVFH